MPVLVHRINLTPCDDGEVTDNGCCSAHVAIRQLVENIDLIIHRIPISFSRCYKRNRSTSYTWKLSPLFAEIKGPGKVPSATTVLSDSLVSNHFYEIGGKLTSD